MESVQLISEIKKDTAAKMNLKENHQINNDSNLTLMKLTYKKCKRSCGTKIIPKYLKTDNLQTAISFKSQKIPLKTTLDVNHQINVNDTGSCPDHNKF